MQVDDICNEDAALTRRARLPARRLAQMKNRSENNDNTEENEATGDEEEEEEEDVGSERRRRGRLKWTVFGELDAS